MKKLICLLFVFTLLSCSSGDDDVVETPANLELTGGWGTSLTGSGVTIYLGIDFGVSSNSTTPYFYSREEDAICATNDGPGVITKRTPTSITMTKEDITVVLTYINSTSVSVVTSGDLALTGTAISASWDKC